MKRMSRLATNEYIGAKRRAYEASKPDKRRLILDDVCEMTGYSRKYANRLLTENPWGHSLLLWGVSPAQRGSVPTEAY